MGMDLETKYTSNETIYDSEADSNYTIFFKFIFNKIVVNAFYSETKNFVIQFN